MRWTARPSLVGYCMEYGTPICFCMWSTWEGRRNSLPTKQVSYVYLGWWDMDRKATSECYASGASLQNPNDNRVEVVYWHDDVYQYYQLKAGTHNLFLFSSDRSFSSCRTITASSFPNSDCVSSPHIYSYLYKLLSWNSKASPILTHQPYTYGNRFYATPAEILILPVDVQIAIWPIIVMKHVPRITGKCTRPIANLLLIFWSKVS